MMIDLLDRTLNRLDADTHTGRIADGARRAMVRVLIANVDVIVEMQRLVEAAPDGAVVDADLVCTEFAPELTITTQTWHLAAWRYILTLREFVEVGIADLGHEYRGPFVLRLVLPATQDMARAA